VKNQNVWHQRIAEKDNRQVKKIVKIDINVCDEKRIRNKNMIGR